jgi:diguanylate cyclase (GGDEF)-like protein
VTEGPAAGAVAAPGLLAAGPVTPDVATPSRTGAWRTGLWVWVVCWLAAGAAVTVFLAIGTQWSWTGLLLWAAIAVPAVLVATRIPRGSGRTHPLPTDGIPELNVVWVLATTLVLPVGYAVLTAAVLEPAARAGPQPRRFLHRLFRVAVAVVGATAASYAAALATGGPLAGMGARPLSSGALAVAAGTSERYVDGALPATADVLGTQGGFRPLTLVGLLVLGAAVAALAGYLVVDLLAVAVAARLATKTAAQTALGGIAGVRDEAVRLSLAVVLAGAYAIAWPLAALVAAPVALGLHRTLLHPQLMRAAHTDPKTGLLTATTWREQAERAWRAGPAGRYPAVVVLDIDRFKQLNDTLGHLAGDQALAIVAEALMKFCRPADKVCRFGGDEFAALLVDAGDAAGRVGERLRQAISDAADRAGIDVTVSVGVARPAGARVTFHDALSAADRALYVAKAAGRDRVVVHVVEGHGGLGVH